MKIKVTGMDEINLPACRFVCFLALQLGKTGELKLGSVRHFILDECDKMLDKLGEHPLPYPVLLLLLRQWPPGQRQHYERQHCQREHS